MGALFRFFVGGSDGEEDGSVLIVFSDSSIMVDQFKVLSPRIGPGYGWYRMVARVSIIEEEMSNA